MLRVLVIQVLKNLSIHVSEHILIIIFKFLNVFLKVKLLLLVIIHKY